MRKALLKLVVVAMAASVSLVLGAASAHAAGRTTCSSGYDGDRMAGYTYTNKSSHVVGGNTAAIDSGIQYTCDVSIPWDADNIVDTYQAGYIYKYDINSYSLCHINVGRWRGYWSSSNMLWAKDLDQISGKCGWGRGPIKVKTTSKGEWSDGTIKTLNTIVTDTRL